MRPVLRAADRLVGRTDSLAPQMKNTGERPRWSAMDAYILVHKYATNLHGCMCRCSHVICRVDSMNVRDDTEIDWKLLPDENWNIWSVHSLQRRWLTMKRSIKGYEEMSHGGESGLSHATAAPPVNPPSRDHGDPEDEEGPVTTAFIWSEEEEQISERRGGGRCRRHGDPAPG